jgi:hypothetical protein
MALKKRTTVGKGKSTARSKARMVTTPGADSSNTSTVTVSTVGVLGRFTCLPLCGPAFFAAASSG